MIAVVTPAEALHYVHAASRAGRLRYTRHAWERMSLRGASEEDVSAACLSATLATHQREDVWKLSGGVDLDGDVLVVIAEVDRTDVVVITVTG
jgi:hypothetical protein